jgi:hypothetical protein
MLGLQYLPAEPNDSLNGLGQSSLSVQVDQWSRFRWGVVSVRNVNTPSDVVRCVWQESKLEPRPTFFGDCAAEHTRVEGNGSTQIGNRNIYLDKAMTHCRSP